MYQNQIQLNQRTVSDVVVFFRIGDHVSIRANDQFLPRGAQILGTAVRIADSLEVTIYESAAEYVKDNYWFSAHVASLLSCVQTGLPIAWAVASAVDDAVCAGDREPLPSDGPDFHAEHAAWVRRQGVSS